jgi:predicted nicotinamide N-methyase
MKMLHPLPSDDLLARWAPLAPVEPDSTVRVHRAHDVFALWKAWEQEAGATQDVPYWAVPWPGAIVLSRFVLAHPELVQGRQVIDLGCGGAVAAIAAGLAGAAEVTANDTDLVALHLAGLNAAANQVTLSFDARDLSRAGLRPETQVVLAADLFYERGPATRLLRCLREAAARGVLVLVADAGRPFAPRTGIEVLSTATVAVDDDLEGVSTRTVRVLRLVAEGA